MFFKNFIQFLDQFVEVVGGICIGGQVFKRIKRNYFVLLRFFHCGCNIIYRKLE